MEDVSPAYPLATDATPGGAPSLSLAETQALLAEALRQQQALRQENEQPRTAQHELAARAARLQVAETVAGMGSYELDLQSGEMHFSEGMYRLFGEAPDSFLPSVAWIDARSDPEDAAAVQRVLAQALHDQQPYRYTRRIRRADGQWRVLESHGRVVADAAGLAMRLEGVVQDKTTQQQTEHDLRASEEQFHLFATISLNPVYKMSADWRQMYRLAGQPFLADTPAATESWMQAYIPAADWPMVSAAIEQATQAKSVFELEHPVILADGSVGWVHSRAVPLLDAQGELVEWLGTGSDITARKLAEQQLQASHELLQATIDSSLDMIQVFEAVRDEQGEIVDFTWLLNNRIAEASYGDVIGQRLLALNPGVVEIGIFDTFKHVVETGQPDQHEWRYVGEQFDGWFYQSTVKLHDGVATTTANITARKQAEQEVLHLKDELTRRAEDKYQALFTAIDEGFCLFELLFDAQGQAVDYRFLEVNSIFEQQTGLTNIIGQLGSSLMIAGIEPHWLDSYAQVVHTGHSVRFENYHQATGRWYEAYASRVGEASQHQVCTVFSDITARKQHEQRQDYLLKLSDALRPLADALQIQAEASRILGEHLGVDRAYYVALVGRHLPPGRVRLGVVAASARRND
jgi:PAS domain S-box-containing protein